MHWKNSKALWTALSLATIMVVGFITLYALEAILALLGVVAYTAFLLCSGMAVGEKGLTLEERATWVLYALVGLSLGVVTSVAGANLSTL